MVIPPLIVRRALEAKKYDTISGDTAAIFSLNLSCLFLIANVMSSIPDRSFFSQTSKIAKIELPHKLIDCMSTEFYV